MSMTVEEAIAEAKSFIARIFADEAVSQIRLEEVEYDEGDKAWLVTLGLMRPTSRDISGAAAALASLPLKRSYKTVRIADDGGGMPSVKIRQLHEE